MIELLNKAAKKIVRAAKRKYKILTGEKYHA